MGCAPPAPLWMKISPSMALHRFLYLRDHLLDEFALQTQNAQNENKGRSNRRHQQVLILAGLRVVSRDFSYEFRCSGGWVICKLGVMVRYQSPLVTPRVIA